MEIKQEVGQIYLKIPKFENIGMIIFLPANKTLNNYTSQCALKIIIMPFFLWLFQNSAF